jgi:cell envelope-related function transcriptional attenuator common domain
LSRKKKNTKKKKQSKVYIIIGGLLLLLSVIFTIYIGKINILPMKYFTPAIVIVVGVSVTLSLVMIFSKKKSIKFISTGISIIFIFGLSYIFYSAFNTMDILKGMNINYKSHNYSVIVNKNSGYNDIKDIKNKSVGYYDNAAKGLDESLEKLREKVKVNYKKYSNLEELAKDLLDGKIDAILLEDSYRAILNDKEEAKEDLKDFLDKTKVIYSFEIKFETEKIVKDINVTKDTFAVYISGIDTYGSISSVSRSDVNMVIVVNPTTHQILMISIPRDYYVQLHGTTGYKDKLTHAGIYGVETSVKTLEDLLSMDINYYVKVNFTSLIKIVDSIGGVDVYSKYSFTSKDKYKYTKGYNKVNGVQALSFVRERKSLPGGDRQRAKNQQAMIDAIFRKGISPSIIINYNSLLKSLEGSFVTNMASDRLISLIKKQLDESASWSLTSYSLDGTDAREYTYSYSGGTLYVMKPDESTIITAKDLIKQVYDGKKLNSSYASNSSNVNNVTKENKPIPINPETNNYTITFNSNGGTEVEPQRIKENESVKEPTPPMYDGYELIGWFYNDELFDFNIQIVQDITLTAKWNQILDVVLPGESEE